MLCLGLSREWPALGRLVAAAAVEGRDELTLLRVDHESRALSVLQQLPLPDVHLPTAVQVKAASPNSGHIPVLCSPQWVPCSPVVPLHQRAAFWGFRRSF